MAAIPSAETGVLAGRDAACARLAVALDLLERGERGAILIRGGVGVGKTHLVRWVVDRAEERRFCTAFLRPPASVPMSFAELAVELLAQLGDRSAIAASSTETAPIIELAERLDDAARKGTVLIVLDDAHSIGPDVRGWLLDAIRLTTPAVGLVATWRTGSTEAPADLGPVGELPVDAIDLDGLDLAGVEAFAQSHLGDPVVPSLVRTLHEATFGNPLFMLERLRDWQATDALEKVGEHWVVATPVERGPTSLNEALRRGSAAFDSAELSVGHALALLDRAASFEQLAKITGLAGEPLKKALASLEVAGWVATQSGSAGVRFRIAHDAYVSALNERTDASAAAALASVIVDELRGDLTIAELTHHSLRALTPPADLDAILRTAATEAEQQGSFKAAAEYWGALAGRVREPQHKDDALLAQARAKRRFDPRAAIALFGDIEACAAMPETRVAAAADRVDLLPQVGPKEEAIPAIGALIERTEGEVRSRLELRLAGVLFSVGRTDEAIPTIDRLAASGSATACGLKAAWAFRRADFDQACRLNVDGLHLATERSEELFLSVNLAWAQIFAGEWDAADRTLVSAIAVARTADEHVRLWRLQACAITLDAWRGRTAAAIDAGVSALRVTRTLAPPHVHADVQNALAVALHESGHPEEGIELVRELGLEGGGVGAITLAELALATGDIGLAEAAAERALATLTGNLVRAASLDRLRAEISLARGDPARAVDLLKGWVEHPPPVALEQGRVNEVRAEALRRTRRRAQAVEACRRALTLYERLGATLHAARVTAWLKQHTVATRPRRAPGEVTEREREVLGLAAQGLTNAEIAERLVLSPGTVKKHMENIFAHTGARRRSELHRFLNSAS